MRQHLLFVGASPTGVGLAVQGPLWTKLIRQARVVAVDGGWGECLRLGIIPDLWVGDGDSLRRSGAKLKIPAESQIYLPRSKDQSDLGVALAEGVKRFAGVKYLHGLGFFGGRWDHEWGGIWEWKGIVQKKTFSEVWLHGAQTSSFFLSPKCPRISFLRKGGTDLSLFALTPHVRGLEIEGLEYPWQKKWILRPGTQGLSNRVVRGKGRPRSRVAISLEKGHLLGVIPHVSEKSARSFFNSKLREVL